MARARTTASERSAYNDRIRTEVEQIVGHPVTVRQATEYRQYKAGKRDEPEWVGEEPAGEMRGSPRGGRTAHLIPQRDITELAERDDLEPIGTLLAQIEDFKVLRGGVASLSLTTSVEFAHLLVDASVLSAHELLVAALYKVPRKAVEDPDESDDGDLP